MVHPSPLLGASTHPCMTMLCPQGKTLEHNMQVYERKCSTQRGIVERGIQIQRGIVTLHILFLIVQFSSFAPAIPPGYLPILCLKAHLKLHHSRTGVRYRCLDSHTQALLWKVGLA
jgi:hypothetical protein